MSGRELGNGRGERLDWRAVIRIGLGGSMAFV